MWEKVFNADNPFWNGMGRGFEMFILKQGMILGIPLTLIGAFLGLDLYLIQIFQTSLFRDMVLSG